MFYAVLTDTGIQMVLSGMQMPRMNSIMERWIPTGPTKASSTLDRYKQFPVPLAGQVQITQLDIRRHQRLGGIFNEYRHAP